MDPMDIDDSYQPVPEPPRLFPPLAFLAATLLVALWIAKRHAGLPNPLWTYFTFAVAGTGIGMLLVSLWHRTDLPGLTAKTLGFLIGLVCVSHILNLGVNGKQDLSTANIGSYVQVAPGVITCVREHFETPGRYRVEPVKQLGWDEFYAYVVNGKVYHQRDFAPTPYFPIGTAVHVFYDIRQPERARLTAPDELLPADALGPAPADTQALLPRPDPTQIAC